jgi:hypothetical protein
MASQALAGTRVKRIVNLFKYLEANCGIHWLCDYHCATPTSTGPSHARPITYQLAARPPDLLSRITTIKDRLPEI